MGLSYRGMMLAWGTILCASIAITAFSDRDPTPILEIPCQSVRVDIGPGSIIAETAHTPKERMTGLMHREDLPEGTGMMFFFEESKPLDFWMRNTFIPLKIIYIDKGRVVSIGEGIPLDETGVPSIMPASHVLEVNLNEPVTESLEPGDAVTWTCVD